MNSFSVGLFVAAFSLVLAFLVWWFLIRKPKPAPARYQTCATLTPRQFQALHYLQAAFPDSVVLLQRALTTLVSPRNGGKPEAARQAQQALDGLKVDFVICSEGGKASYAFDLDAPENTAQSAHAHHKASRKNAILKSAGVRLILLKGHSDQWPTPAEFRLKLALAALKPLSPASEPEVYKAPTDVSRPTPASQGPESSIMGMSVLMELEGDDAESAWRAARD